MWVVDPLAALTTVQNMPTWTLFLKCTSKCTLKKMRSTSWVPWMDCWLGDFDVPNGELYLSKTWRKPSGIGEKMTPDLSATRSPRHCIVLSDLLVILFLRRATGPATPTPETYRDAARPIKLISRVCRNAYTGSWSFTHSSVLLQGLRS